MHKNAQGVNSARSTFVYDGFSRKAIAREYTWNSGTSSWSQTSETRSVHDGMEVVQERDASNVIQTKYVRDGNIGGLLSKSTSTETFFYHYDGSGNVVQMSDAAKAVVAEYRYDAFGNTLSATGAQAQSNRYRFSTKELHTQSGLYDYGYRFYSPGLGRWINRDPIEEAGGLNLYAAFGNDSVNKRDEYGLVIPAIVIAGVAVAPEVVAGGVAAGAATVAAGAAAIDWLSRNPLPDIGPVSHPRIDPARSPGRGGRPGIGERGEAGKNPNPNKVKNKQRGSGKKKKPRPAPTPTPAPGQPDPRNVPTIRKGKKPQDPSCDNPQS